MSGYCPECGNTLCICSFYEKSTYPFRLRVKELEENDKIRKCMSCGEMAMHSCGSKYLDKINVLTALLVSIPRIHTAECNMRVGDGLESCTCHVKEVDKIKKEHYG